MLFLPRDVRASFVLLVYCVEMLSETDLQFAGGVRHRCVDVLASEKWLRIQSWLTISQWHVHVALNWDPRTRKEQTGASADVLSSIRALVLHSVVT